MTEPVLCVISHGNDKDGTPRRAEADWGQLCRNHWRRLDEWLRDIAIDFALLDTRIAPMKSSGDLSSDGRGTSDEARPPINLGVASLRDTERGGAPRDRGDELWYELPDIPSVLPTVHAVAEALRSDLDPSHDHDDSVKDRTVTGEINYLIAGFGSLVAAQWVDESFGEIKTVWIALQRAHNRPRPQPLGRCLTLECQGTVWPRQETAPWCSECRRVYDTNAEIIKVRLEDENRKKAKSA